METQLSSWRVFDAWVLGGGSGAGIAGRMSLLAAMPEGKRVPLSVWEGWQLFWTAAGQMRMCSIRPSYADGGQWLC